MNLSHTASKYVQPHKDEVPHLSNTEQYHSHTLDSPVVTGTPQNCPEYAFFFLQPHHPRRKRGPASMTAAVHIAGTRVKETVRVSETYCFCGVFAGQVSAPRQLITSLPTLWCPFIFVEGRGSHRWTAGGRPLNGNSLPTAREEYRFGKKVVLCVR